MKNKKKEEKANNKTQVKSMKKRLYIALVIINLILIYATYKVMPVIQNYPPNSENIAFQKSVEQFSHVEQYIMIFLVGTGIHIFALNKSLKNICNFLNKYYRKQKIAYEDIKKTRADCINVPYKFYLLQIVIVLVLGMLLTFLLISDGLAILKFFLMLLAITTLIEILQFILIQRELNNVMIKTYKLEGKYEKELGIRLGFSKNLILQIIPFIAVSIIIISLVGYAKATEQLADTNASYYEAYLDNRNFDNLSVNELKNTLYTIPLKNNDDYFFILSSDYSQEYVSKEGVKISDFFKKYLDFYFKGNKGIVYEFYGTEQQAFTLKLIDKYNEIWYVGFEYSTADYSLMTFYVSIMLGALAIYTLFIFILAKNISNNIVNVSNSLKKILEKGNSEQKGRLPILSNDEIGDLSYYYNKIEELTQKNIEDINEKQRIILNQDKLSTIGRIAGDMAHAINTPNATIGYNIDYLKGELENKEPELIENLNVMKQSSDFIKKLVNSMRDQIRNLKNTEKIYFNLKETVEGIGTIVGLEIKKANCGLLIDIDKNICIFGEKNKFEQVIMNLINNSVQAYEDIQQKGYISVTGKKTQNYIVIEVIDKAGGIPEKLQDMIFKDTFTTKGSRGTGIGLMIVHSIIVGDFGGDISFVTEEGVGTKFIIKLKEERKNENE